MRIMPISDSPKAPTGFGTNTKNIACIFTEEGHTIGYGGCQNTAHEQWKEEWPLGSGKEVEWENLPIMFPGQERFGEKSFEQWLSNFRPDLILTHLDIQMFSHVVERKRIKGVNIPLYDKDNKLLNKKERLKLLETAAKEVAKGVPWKLASIIPFDGQPSVKDWWIALEQIDYPVCMSSYGKEVVKADFPQLGQQWHDNVTVIPHGVDTNFFKPKLNVKPDDAFVVGCVARNQHRKNIPRLIKAFKYFVEKNNLTPKEARLLLHMDWEDYMGWKIEPMAEDYGVKEFLIPRTMGGIDKGGGVSEEAMVDIYNMMDIFALPTAGEGFGIPTIEAMSCGLPVLATNYTTTFELVGADNPYEDEIPLFPYGQYAQNGRDTLEDEDFTNRGCLVPYKDLWWDTPQRAAPMRAIVSEVAMGEAMDRYYHNRDMVFEHGKNARAHMKKFYDWSVIGQRWKDFVKRVEKEQK